MSNTNVAIVGAGAAGLSSAFELAIDGAYNFQILEASTSIGGRLQKLEGFANDFPIDVGGEWIHVHPTILDILAYENVTDQLDIVQYISEYEEWDNGTWVTRQFNNTDYKFRDYTWYDFFNDYIAPFVEDNLHLDCQVTSIDWSSSPNRLQCSDGREWFADKVIVTVSIKILQDSDIQFTPPLPEDTQSAIETIQMLSGIKAFFKFSERFYQDAFEFASDYQWMQFGERYFYDITYGQISDENILGMFAVGDPAEQLVILSDQDIVTSTLNDLDSIFGGLASANFIEAHVQNWDQEPFVRGAYSHFSQLWPIRTLRNSTITEDRIFFAGEAIPIDYEWGFAHGAALSGRYAAERVLALLQANNVRPAGDFPTASPTSSAPTTNSPVLDPTAVPTSLPTESATVLPVALPTKSPSQQPPINTPIPVAVSASEPPMVDTSSPTLIENNDSTTSGPDSSNVNSNTSNESETDTPLASESNAGPNVDNNFPSEAAVSGTSCMNYSAAYLVCLLLLGLHHGTFSLLIG